MPIRTAAVLVAALLVPTLVACGGSDTSGDDGPTIRARELLVDIGIEEADADCLIDELGADTIIEAPDLAVLADGRPYQEAAQECFS